MEKYKVAVVWRMIEPMRDKMEWHKLLWALYTIPKCVFIALLAILNRLPTNDRRQSWGIEVEMLCDLCKQKNETRNHMFFGCEFSRSIWKEVLQLSGLRKEVLSWDEKMK